METCGNLRRPAARGKSGVPGPSVCKVESLKKDPSGPRLYCAMEVEVENVLMCSIFPFFLFSFFSFPFFSFFSFFAFLFFSFFLFF